MTTPQPLTNAELFIAAMNAKEWTRAVERHLKDCPKCKATPFGMCEEGVQIVVGMPDNQKN